MLNKIDSSEISVVVQGVVDKKDTFICLQSVREQLPNAEIILSTYNDIEQALLNKLKGLYDKIVLSDKQQVIKDIRGKRNNNIFGQIISTQNGLKQATKKYAIKMRSDLKMKNTNFLNYFNKFDKIRSDEVKIFNKHILCLSCFCINPRLTKQSVYYINDWFNFGLTDDIKNFWNTNCHNDIKLVNNDKDTITRASMMNPEQYIVTDCLIRNNINVDFNSCLEYKDEDIDKHEKFIANNVVIVDYERSGIFMQKGNRKYSIKHDQYCFGDWLSLYQKYCNKNQQLFDNNYYSLRKLYVSKNYFGKYCIRIKHCFFGFCKNKLKRNIITIITAPIRIVYFFLSLLYHSIPYFLLILVNFNKKEKVEKQLNFILETAN